MSQDNGHQSEADVTALLRSWADGDPSARDKVISLVYEELKRQAARYLRRERSGHTLQPTALVHEAFLRLSAQTHVDWRNRAQFFGVAAQMMRRILVDHARGRQATKRSGGVQVALDEDIASAPPLAIEVLMLDQALSELTVLDERQGQIVELRYFGGLSVDDVAAVLSLSRATVGREWQMARAWLYRRMIPPGQAE